MTPEILQKYWALIAASVLILGIVLGFALIAWAIIGGGSAGALVDMGSVLVVIGGGIAATMGCYYGMNSGRGAQGVGRATKASVQAAAVLILAANYILTELFFSA